MGPFYAVIVVTFLAGGTLRAVDRTPFPSMDDCKQRVEQIVEALEAGPLAKYPKLITGRCVFKKDVPA